MKEWMSENIVNIIIPIICAVLSWWLAVHHERKGNKNSEIKTLRAEISILKSKLNLYEAVERFADSDCYIMKATGEIICPTCWGAEHKPIPAHDNGTGHYTCPHCSGKGIYSHKVITAYKEKKDKEFADFSKAIDEINRNHRNSLQW